MASKREKNKAIFSLLIERAQMGGVIIEHPSGSRWINSSEGFDRNFLVQSKEKGRHFISSGKQLLISEFEENIYIISLGFPASISGIRQEFEEVEFGGGVFTQAIYALKPPPIKGADVLKQHIELCKELEPSYVGHSVDDVKKIFPEIKIYKIIDSNEFKLRDFMLCIALHGRGFGDSWYGDALKEKYLKCCDHEKIDHYWQQIFNSALAARPELSFLYAYHAIEQLYGATQVPYAREHLREGVDPHLFVVELLSNVGLRAKESDEIKSIFKLCDQETREFVSTKMKCESSSVPKYIYDIRNYIAHSRPALNKGRLYPNSLEKWEFVIDSLLEIVMDLYGKIK